MDAKILARMVEVMRLAQKEFFRTRSADALAKARSHEERVDRVVRSLLTQPQLPGMEEHS